ncbi:MAG: hypothetical protein COY58_01980 [Gammaproteobacteria bacterium CG_4_10_14_0_8_um_filter_38_16]|nr:MAG: hypothetical protein COY58_01980 [Gammaproteobacteria bacterium CG_4_10_14_0_8_um_filter_38_16]PJA04084.1 MAG: hypothetical protein COX72_01765 [Gammaproteobacteria bacterium CG_4_10_14_0_2_um_filter_38_22]PJB10049.1 MAG: hypothetical protein CO120_07140 [Gammaproteobacteria bacterium CG_4_9_14_3_um_filter_38_9]
MSLKILWVTSSFPVDPKIGKNLYLWHPLQALKNLGAKCVVLNMQPWKPMVNKSIDEAQFEIDIVNRQYFSIPRHYCRAISNYSCLLKAASEIKKLHARYQFDVIHAHGEICGLPAVAISKKLHIPVAVTIHGIDMCKRLWQGRSGKQFNRMFKEANKIIYVGKPLQQHFRHITNDKAHFSIVHNGFRLPVNQSLTERVFENQKIIQIISVSNLHEGKGIDLTLYALSFLKNQGVKNWFYTIIGDGDQRKYLEKIIMQCNLSDQVKLIGQCAHEAVYDYLKKSDLFCLPSYREAFGIAYLEAMAHGLLTIGVKGQGAQAFIDQGKTGFLVSPNDMDDLKQTLFLAITQFHTMKAISFSGKEHVIKNFTWKQNAEKLMAIYKEIGI